MPLGHHFSAATKMSDILLLGSTGASEIQALDASPDQLQLCQGPDPGCDASVWLAHAPVVGRRAQQILLSNILVLIKKFDGR